MNKGILITFEGGEGCGKSTQLKLLYDYLKKKGRRVYLTREPGGTQIGDEIRQILLNKKHNRMTPVTETLLYMASRSQIVEEVIKPRLKKGYVVLCDRWLDATVAYQGYGAGADIAWINSLGRITTGGIEPKRTLFFDLPVEIGLRRAKSHKSADRMERKKLLFHRKVCAGYRAIAKKESGRIIRVPVTPSDTVSEVHARVLRAVSPLI
ncbi:MAG: dTMP kinase [Omnitrophica bacterium RIFCSPHIGHO2_02_FULL_51_18]|nr:MAG: dTMP kinase [Omnitrophica bacterium RIFCSPHIGHO2_02_FULL_51_18]